MNVAQLYDRHAAQLHAFARLLTGDGPTAEDAVQECFVRVARHPRRLAAADDVPAYLFTVLRNETRRLGARWSRWRRLDRAGAARRAEAERPDPAAGLEGEVVRAALGRLPPAQREVVFLRVWQAMTFPAIGGVLGISPNTAASRYRYGLEKLRADLGDEHD